jgi:hypothetical protein
VTTVFHCVVFFPSSLLYYLYLPDSLRSYNSESAGHFLQAFPCTGDVLEDIEIYDVANCRWRFKLDGFFEIGLRVIIAIRRFGKARNGRKKGGEDEKREENKDGNDAVKVFQDVLSQKVLTHVFKSVRQPMYLKRSIPPGSPSGFRPGSACVMIAHPAPRHKKD